MIADRRAIGVPDEGGEDPTTEGGLTMREVVVTVAAVIRDRPWALLMLGGVLTASGLAFATVAIVVAAVMPQS